MPDEPKNLAYYLLKAEDFRQKARVVKKPGLKAALEAVAREFMEKARKFNPPSSEVRNEPVGSTGELPAKILTKTRR